MMKTALYLISMLLSVLLFSSCERKGCTDALSYMYDKKADKDDGSCAYYYGGREYGRINVASIVSSSSDYTAYINGTKIGSFDNTSSYSVSCSESGKVGKDLLPGQYVVKVTGNNEVRQGSVFVGPQECKLVIVQDLPLVTTGGGGSSGYNCIGGSCKAVSQNAHYASFIDCNNNCGASGGTGDLTFWLNQDLGCGYIYVSVSSKGTKTVTHYYTSGNPGCGAVGSANFTGLPYGTYSYSATSDNGCTWNNIDFTLGQSCKTILLIN